MAEHNIANNAGTLVATAKTDGPWICRDDDGNYWTIFQNIDNNITIYKSTDSGSTWTLKKTLTTADFTSITFPIDGFNIANLTGQDKVYIILTKKAYTLGKCWGWVINTSTDVGAKDLDGVALTNYQSRALNKSEIRWDSYNNKLYIGWGADSTFSDTNAHYQEVVLNGTLGSAVNLSVGSSHYPGGFAIDSVGIKFFISFSASGAGYYARIVKSGSSKDTTYTNSTYLFYNLICDYNDKLVFGFVIGTILHLYRANNSLSTFEINDSQKDLGTSHTPSAAFLTVDGNNDIYWFYTDSYDNEAYYVKYTVSTASWGTATKISSDNDGMLVCPELRSPTTDNKVLVSYQSIA
jgi:hypothetical protein